MNKFLQTLIPLVVLLIMLANPTRAQRMTTFFSYDFNGNRPTPTLILQGKAGFQPDSPYLRLSATDANGGVIAANVGRAVHSGIITLRTGGFQADFETTLKFLITPVDSSPADGLAFFIAPVNARIPDGSYGGNLGIFDPSGSTSRIFAVEFDTVPNAWDPDYRHVGIDNQFRKSGNHTRVDDAIIGQEVTARISYDAAATRTSVRVSTAGGQKFEVIHVHNLSTFLPPQVQVGLSAATGESVAMHDILSWSWTSAINFGSFSDHSILDGKIGRIDH